MKRFRLGILCIAALVIILMIPACGSGNNATTSTSMTAQEKYSIVNDAGYAEDVAVDMDYMEMEESEMVALAAEGEVPEVQRKVIQSSYLELEADNAEDLYGKLVAFCKGLGGYEFSYNISNHDEYSVINAEFKLPPQKLNEFVEFAGECGKIINSSMTSEDITDSYFDYQTRLETKRKALEQYYALLERTRGIEEIVAIQGTIDRLTEDIEAFEGRLRVWDSQVSMSTVGLHIRQQNDPVKIRRDIRWNALTLDDMGYHIQSGFMSLFNVVAYVVQWGLIAAAIASPVLIIIGITAVVLWIKSKKKRGLKEMGPKP